jgi:uncharacterized protein involved in oxidation of intracellular sulfur
LIADAAACAKKNQKTPNGYYNLEKMLTVAKRKGIDVGVCGSCMDARGMSEEELHESSHKAQWMSLQNGPSGLIKLLLIKIQ